MTVQKISVTLVLVSLSITLGLFCPAGWAEAADSPVKSKNKSSLGKSGKKASPAQKNNGTVASGGCESAIKNRLQELTVALANSDAKAVSSIWVEDGTYSNEIGQEWKGRAALEKRFAAVFTSEGRLLLDFIPATVRQLADNVATVDGFVKFKDEVGGSPDTRFAMVFQKQGDGTWSIVSASETPFVDSERLDHLKPLAWLIGDWAVEKGGNSMVVKIEWAANKRFIHLRYMIKKAGSEELDSQQIIGWDPRREQIVSWIFDSRGGFGSGTWSRRDNQWLVDSEGVDPEGRSTSATNIIASKSANSFSWQSVNRIIEGESLSDTAPLTINRR